MNWKHIVIGIIGTVCLFLFLGSVWHDLHPDLADLYLETIVINPEGR